MMELKFSELATNNLIYIKDKLSNNNLSDLERYYLLKECEEINLLEYMFQLDEYKKHDPNEIVLDDDDDDSFSFTVDSYINMITEWIDQHKYNRAKIEGVIEYLLTKEGANQNEI